MAFRPVPTPFTHRQLQICTNQRAPETGKPSCGRHGGVELRERLKRAVKEGGKRGAVQVIGTSCLGVCPAEGVMVGLLPDHAWGVVGPDEEAALLAVLLNPEAPVGAGLSLPPPEP